MSAPIIRIREDSLWSQFLVKCDHDGVISADVYGRPTPTVTWYFDLGEKVNEGERFRTVVEDGGRRHRLVITDVCEELDRRFVTIFAENIHGWDMAMMDLKAFRVYPKYRPSDLRRIPSTIHPSDSDISSDSFRGNSIRHRRECHSMPRSLPCTPSQPRRSNLVRNQSCRTPRVKILDNRPRTATGTLDDPNNNNNNNNNNYKNNTCKTREIDEVLKRRNDLSSENIRRRIIKADKRTARGSSSTPRNRSSDSGFGEIRRSSSATLRSRNRSTTCHSGGSDDAFYDDLILPRDASVATSCGGSAVILRRGGLRRLATAVDSGYGDLGENLWHVTAGNEDRDYLLGKLIRASIESAFLLASESREIVKIVQRSRKDTNELNTLEPDDRSSYAKNLGHDGKIQSERVQFDATRTRKPISLLGLDQASAGRKPTSDRNKDCRKLEGENSGRKELVDFERGDDDFHDSLSVVQSKSTTRAVEGSNTVMKTAQKAKIMPRIKSGKNELLKVKDVNQRPFVPLKSPVKPNRQYSAKVHEENSGKRSTGTISSALSATRKPNLNAQDPKPHSTVDQNDGEVDGSFKLTPCLPKQFSHYDKRTDEGNAISLDNKIDKTPACELFTANGKNEKPAHKNKLESINQSSKSLSIENSVRQPRTRVSQTANEVHRISDTSDTPVAESNARNQDTFSNSHLRQKSRHKIEGSSSSAASDESKNLSPRKSKTLDNVKKTPEDVDNLKECRITTKLGKTVAKEAASAKPDSQKGDVENRRLETKVDVGSKRSSVGLDVAENDTFSSMSNKQTDRNQRQAPLKSSCDLGTKRSDPDHKDNKTHRTGQSEELAEIMDGTGIPGKDSSILARWETNEMDSKGKNLQRTNYKKKQSSLGKNDVPLLDETQNSTGKNYSKMTSKESSDSTRNQNFDGKEYYNSAKIGNSDPSPAKPKELDQDTAGDENEATADENSASEQTDYHLSTLSVTKKGNVTQKRLPTKQNARTLITPTAGDILCSSRRKNPSKNDRVHRMAKNKPDEQGHPFEANKRSSEVKTKDTSLLSSAAYEDKQGEQLEGTNGRDSDFPEIRETRAKDEDVVTDNVRQIEPSVASRVLRKRRRKRTFEPDDHQAILSPALLNERGIRKTTPVLDETKVNSDTSLGQTDDVEVLQLILNDMEYVNRASLSELAPDNREQVSQSLDEEEPLPKESMEQSATDGAAFDQTITKMTRGKNTSGKTHHTNRRSTKPNPNSKAESTTALDKSFPISKRPAETPKQQRPMSVKIRSYRPIILQPIVLDVATGRPPRLSEVSEDFVQSEPTPWDDRQSERSPCENPLDQELGSRHSLSSNDLETSSGFDALENDIMLRKNENSFEDRPHDNHRGNLKYTDHMFSDNEAKLTRDQAEKDASLNFECSSMMPPLESAETVHSKEQKDRSREFENRESRPHYEAEQKEITREGNVPELIPHNKTDEVGLTSFEIEENDDSTCEDADRSFDSASPKRTADASFPFYDGVVPLTSSISVAPEHVRVKNKTYSVLEHKILMNYTAVKEEAEFSFHDTADLCYDDTEEPEQKDTAHFDTFTEDNSLEDMKICDATNPMHNQTQRRSDDVESNEEDVSNQSVDRLREICSAELKMNRLDFSAEFLGTEPASSNSNIQIQSFDPDRNKYLTRCSSDVIETDITTEAVDNQGESRDGTRDLRHPGISICDLSTAGTSANASHDLETKHEKCIEVGGNLEEQVSDDYDAHEIRSDEEFINSATFTAEGTVAAVDSDSQSRIHEAKFVETTASGDIVQQSIDEQNDDLVLIQKDECTNTSEAQEFMNISLFDSEAHNEFSCEKEDTERNAIFHDYDEEVVSDTRLLKQAEHTEDDGIATVSRFSHSQSLLQPQLPSLSPPKVDHRASEEYEEDFKTDDDFAPDFVDHCRSKSPPSDSTVDDYSISNDSLSSPKTNSPVFIQFHSSFDDVHNSSSATDEVHVTNLDRREAFLTSVGSSNSETSGKLLSDDRDTSMLQCHRVHDTISSDEPSETAENDHFSEDDNNNFLLMRSYQIGQSGVTYAGEEERNDKSQWEVMHIEIENDVRCLLTGTTDNSKRQLCNQFPIEATLVEMNNDLGEMDLRDFEKRPSITNLFSSSSSEPMDASDSTSRSAEAAERASHSVGIMPGHSENKDDSYNNVASSTKINNTDGVCTFPVSEEQNTDIVTLLSLTEPDITDEESTFAKSAEIEDKESFLRKLSADSEYSDISLDLKSKQQNDNISLSNMQLSEVRSENECAVSDLQYGVKENDTIAFSVRETNTVSENHTSNLHLMEVENKKDISRVLSVKGNDRSKPDFDSGYNSDLHAFSTASEEKENASQVSTENLQDKDTFYHKPSSEIRIKENNSSVLQNLTDNKGVTAHVFSTELDISYDVPLDISKQDYHSDTIYSVQSSSIENEYHSSHIQLPEIENVDDFHGFPEPENPNNDKSSDVLQQEYDTKDISISFAASSGTENRAYNLTSADSDVGDTDDYALANETQNKNSADGLLEEEQTNGDADRNILLKAKYDEDGFYIRSTEIGTRENLSQVPTAVFQNKVDTHQSFSSEISNTCTATEMVASFVNEISTSQDLPIEDEIKDDISYIQHRVAEKQSVGFQVRLSELENKHFVSNDLRTETESVNNDHHDVPMTETADESKTTSADIDSKHSNVNDDSLIEFEDDDKIFQVPAAEDQKKYDTSRKPSAKHDTEGDDSCALVKITENKDNVTFVLSRELGVENDDHHVISAAKENGFNTSRVHSTAMWCSAEPSHLQESTAAKEESDKSLEASLTELEVRGNSAQAHHTDYECTVTSFDHLTEDIEDTLNAFGLSRTEVDNKNSTSVLQTGSESAKSAPSTENTAIFSSVLSTEIEDMVAGFDRKGEHISQREAGLNEERYIPGKISEDGAFIPSTPSSPNNFNTQTLHLGVDFEENLKGETHLATSGPMDSGFFSLVQSDADVSDSNTENASAAFDLVSRLTEIRSERTSSQNGIDERILSMRSAGVDRTRNVIHDPISREFLTSDERSTKMESTDTGSARGSMDSWTPVVVREDSNVPVLYHEESDLGPRGLKVNSGPNPTSSIGLPLTVKSVSVTDSGRIDSLRPVVSSRTSIGNFPVEEEEEEGESERADDRHMSRRTDDTDDADGEVDNADVNRNTRKAALIAGALGILAIGVAVIVAIRYRDSIGKDVSK